MPKRLIVLLFCSIYGIHGIPTTSSSSPSTPRRAETTDDVQLIHPHIITIERLESLLRRAGEIFGTAQDNDDNHYANAKDEEAEAEQPKQHMLPPDQPYNFYLPLYDYIDPKLDEKSRRMEKIVPPPPQGSKTEHNYYTAKPKKIPKKFNSQSKHVNLKWLNTYEKAMGGAAAAAPKAIYLEQDERNRINFDDSFFAVDMQTAQLPDNQPHREPSSGAELLQHGEELPEEDLMAAPAQISYAAFKA